MDATLKSSAGAGLEPLCGRSSAGETHPARIRFGPGGAGIERLEAHFHGRAFSPHRHDSYAIGITLAGVQTFRYRGEQRHCLPGQCHILHPDELHDGAAGTDAGFRYRIVYIDPQLVQNALAGAPLPFVASPVVAAAQVPDGFAADALDIDTELDEVTRNDIVAAVTELLTAAAPNRQARTPALALAAVSRVRELIAASPAMLHAMDELERVSGLDRWTLA